MSIPLLIDQVDLERAMGAAKFVQLFDNGSGRPQADQVQHFLQIASDAAAGLLGDGFTPDEAVGLARRDASIRQKIAIVGIGEAFMGRSEFMDPTTGKFLYADAYDRARKDLEAIGEKTKRSVAEQQNGTVNRLTSPRIGLRRARPRRFVFADSPDKPGGGPF